MKITINNPKTFEDFWKRMEEANVSPKISTYQVKIELTDEDVKELLLRGIDNNSLQQQKNVIEKKEKKKNSDLVLECIARQNRILTIREIVEETTIEYNQVNQVLTKLLKSKKIERVGRGEYKLLIPQNEEKDSPKEEQVKEEQAKEEQPKEEHPKEEQSKEEQQKAKKVPSKKEEENSNLETQDSRKQKVELLNDLYIIDDNYKEAIDYIYKKKVVEVAKMRELFGEREVIMIEVISNSKEIGFITEDKEGCYFVSDLAKIWYMFVKRPRKLKGFDYIVTNSSLPEARVKELINEGLRIGFFRKEKDGYTVA